MSLMVKIIVLTSFSLVCQKITNFIDNGESVITLPCIKYMYARLDFQFQPTYTCSTYLPIFIKFSACYDISFP